MVAGVAVGTAVHPERCPRVDRAAIDDAARAAVSWFAANTADDGEVLYSWDRGTDRSPGGRNVVRHAGVVMALHQAVGAGIPGARAVADRSLRWALERLVETPVGPALALGDPAPTGATALLVAALVIRGRVGGDVDGELLRALGSTLVATVGDDGSVAADVSVVDGPVRRRTSPFFPGEVAWALALLDGVLPGEAYGEAADRVLAWIVTARDEVEGPWPPVSDHWAAYARAERVRSGVALPAGVTTDALTRWRERQLGLFGLQVRYESQRRGGWTRVTRGRQAPASGLGTLGEGLGRWLAVDAVSGELAGRRPVVVERLACVTGLLVERQVDERAAASEPDPARVAGAWFRDGVTRLDDQQHALSALLVAAEVFADPLPVGEGGRP